MRAYLSPFFIIHQKPENDPELRRLSISLVVSFWLDKPYIVAETLEDILQRPIVAMDYLADAIFTLVVLGAYDLAKEKMARIRQVLSLTEQERFNHSLELCDAAIETLRDLKTGVLYLQSRALTSPTVEEERLIWFTLRQALDTQDEEASERIVRRIAKMDTKFSHQEIMDALIAEKLLYQGDSEHLQQILAKYPAKVLAQESCPLYFVNGCYLEMIYGAQSATSEFCKLLDMAFPRTWVLGAHFLAGKIHMSTQGWFSRSFAWERKCLYQQLRLFWHVAKDPEKSAYWKNLI